MDKNMIKGLLRESLLSEFIGQDMISLKKYFSMTDDEKKSYLPHEYSYEFDEFISDMDLDIQIEGEHYEIIDELEQNYPEIYNQFSNWLYKNIQNQTLGISDAEYPAWSFFSDPTLIKNQWLIHFTNQANDIGKEGFKYGVNEMDKLGLTTHLGEFEKKYGGYNFAYTLTDYLKYAKGRNTFKYGKEAVIFRASGIKLWHHADSEPQVIFYGNTATNIVPITEHYGEYYVDNNKTGKTLFANQDFDRVVDWVINNYIQYRKKI